MLEKSQERRKLTSQGVTLVPSTDFLGCSEDAVCLPMHVLSKLLLSLVSSGVNMKLGNEG